MITIIVPVYNVARYLSKCFESLLTQEYRDIEIIAIDDGSTDNSGLICDHFSRRDKRIHVIHTENKGLSAARNTGIDNAHGEWIMFVDGDDWVEKDFCRLSLQLSISNHADMVIFGYVWEKGNKVRKTSGMYEGIISHETAIDHGSTVVWNKLYARHLFNNIRFPHGHVFEDIYTTHKLIYMARTIAMLPMHLYHHVYRRDSISYTKNANERKDNFLASIQRYDDLILSGYPREKAIVQLQNAAVSYCIRTNPSMDPLFLRTEEIAESIDKKENQLRSIKNIAFHLWRLDRRLFHILCKIMGCKTN